MTTRREFLRTGLHALAIGLAARHARAAAGPGSRCIATGAGGLWASHPLRGHEPPTGLFFVDGVPFADRWFGEPWSFSSIPFHASERVYPGGVPPEPQEYVDVAVVGGGLSGLAVAYLLREHRPVLFELHTRFGGTSVGETWRGTDYSLGGAYFITPDEGSFLERLYRRLGVDRIARQSPSTDDLFELNGAIVPAFWDGAGLPAADRQAFETYRGLVQAYVEDYPEIPLEPTADNAWILDLDRLSLKQHIESVVGGPLPALLHAAIQGYCYSAFNAGWADISAAAGWNFIAAEEYGRWVLPGGNAGLAAALWEGLRPLEAGTPAHCPPRFLRSGARVVEVRVLGPRCVRVVWKGSDSVFRTLIARRVVLCAPKHICRHLLVDLSAVEPSRVNDFLQVRTEAYVVANVRLNARLSTDFYDLFLLRNGVFPDEHGVEAFARITDVVRGDFARALPRRRSVLTMYFPLPFAFSRGEIIDEIGLRSIAARTVPEIDLALRTLGLRRADVESVRLARWGHSMPIPRPGLLADGVCQRMRKPFMDDVFFVNADNWALPAVETCLLEAESMRPLIEAGL